jgi:hypothetical protein
MVLEREMICSLTCKQMSKRSDGYGFVQSRVATAVDDCREGLDRALALTNNAGSLLSCPRSARTSPSRPASAIATAFLSLATSIPTNASP